ncbi:MAG: stage 0 sporulation family protein [Geobacteraceae bacterium]|nr:stage 0 sporulation family protein [Geobacteraceae bacterium]
MTIRIAKVQFHTAGKLYDFNAGALELKQGDKVIVETERGRSIATVVVAPVEFPKELAQEGMKSIMRKAYPEDLEAATRNAAKEKEAYDFCLARLKERGMAMKLVKVEYLYDGSKAIFYFTADGRVDFRELVKDLAHTFHTRIEMRQIGVRDEAKMVGGIGICGRELCCSSFLREFEPVSVKMAKEQNLALNPVKISGQCGRLLCCLGYEFETYCTLRKCLPKCGKVVQAGKVKGEVVKLDLLGGTVTIKTDSEGEVVLKGDDIKPENISDRVKKPLKENEKAPEAEPRRETRESPPRGSGKGRRERPREGRDKEKKPSRPGNSGGNDKSK